MHLYDSSTEERKAVVDNVANRWRNGHHYSIKF